MPIEKSLTSCMLAASDYANLIIFFNAAALLLMLHQHGRGGGLLLLPATATAAATTALLLLLLVLLLLRRRRRLLLLLPLRRRRRRPQARPLPPSPRTPRSPPQILMYYGKYAWVCRRKPHKKVISRPASFRGVHVCPETLQSSSRPGLMLQAQAVIDSKNLDGCSGPIHVLVAWTLSVGCRCSI